MKPNPYSSPKAITEEPLDDASIQFRVFRAKQVSFKISSGPSNTELRCEVQRAIDQEIGVENVISIAEHARAFDVFTIVVWYRSQSPQSAG